MWCRAVSYGRRLVPFGVVWCSVVWCGRRVVCYRGDSQFSGPKFRRKMPIKGGKAREPSFGF